MERDDYAYKVLEVSAQMADGYRRNITSFSTDAEKDASEKCATAASNTGYFICAALGLSHEEIVAMNNVLKHAGKI